ncbi:hypothetical protein YDYSG_60040 [Paenibacillus tyrfis]|nr:hypothetical protein YDYSG_60040 [Paenibacillus tyrfis]GMX66936.1 hypothetical protein Elgi_62090 [Paenibacillus elgii]
MALHAENCVQGCFALLDGLLRWGESEQAICAKGVANKLAASFNFWALTIVPELLSQSKNVKNILKNCSFFVTFLCFVASIILGVT